MTDTGLPTRRVLVVEPDPALAAELGQSLVELGADVQVVGSAEDAWRSFSSFRPSHVFAAFGAGEKDGEWFLRRLHSEYLGTLPEVYLTCGPEALARAVTTEPDAILVAPIGRDALFALLHPKRPGYADSPARQATRLRELYELSLLGPDLIRELDAVVGRASLVFQVSDCLVWGPEREPYWPRSARSLDDDAKAAMRARCRLAAAATTTVVVGAGPGSAGAGADSQSLLAAPLGPAGGAATAGIALVSDGVRRFTSEERDALRVLARRLSGELAWMSAHNRLVIEHEKLRRAALLDPLLGVWTRAALEQSIDAQLSVGDAQRVPLALAVLDYHQLRAVNDHYGHVIGDAVLAKFAATVAGALRPRDRVGRFGGDELAVLFVDTELDEASRLTRAVIARLEAAPFRDDGHDIPMVVHAGLTSVGALEHGGRAAFARALGAMARARRSRAPLAVAEAQPERDAPEVAPGGPASIPAGSTLGGMYRILHEISRGAMGVVYRGEDLGLGRQVALKVLRSDLSADRELVDKFRAEAALLASLRHHNLVQVYSLGVEGEDVFFVMELVEGEPLSTTITRLVGEGARIDDDDVAMIVEEVAGALDALHDVGIVHRDVKPENILVDRSGDRAVLVDVGIARRVSDVRDAAGTPGYAAPECFMEADETAATDVYGLAATTYAMLTGRPPYDGGPVAQVVEQQLAHPPPKPSTLRRDLSSAVDAVLLTALCSDPARRYRSASSFAIALGRALELGPARGSRPSRRDTAPVVSDVAADSTYRMSAPIVPERPSELGHSRGALCQVAAMTVGSELGPGWLDGCPPGDPVRDLVEPTLSPTSWQPLESLLAVLTRVAEHASDPRGLARRTGAAMTSATLASFFGADPSTHTPAHLLLAADSYWRRMHSWGRIAVRSVEREAMIELAGVPREPLLCAVLEGSFERIAALGGGEECACRTLSCVSDGGDLCRFVVRWS